MCGFYCKLFIFTCHDVLSNSWFVFAKGIVKMFFFFDFQANFILTYLCRVLIIMI